MGQISALNPPDAGAIAAQKRRIAELEDEFGGTWIEAMRAAPTVSQVENIAKPMLEAALGRPVSVDLAPGTTHLISAKEVATALITLSIAHPEADLAAVEFGEIDRLEADTTAVVSGGDDGAIISFSAEDYNARTRFDRISANLNDFYGVRQRVTQPPLGAARVAVHEFAHVLQFTVLAHSKQWDGQTDGRGVSPTKTALWNNNFDSSGRPQAVPGPSEDLLADVDRAIRKSADRVRGYAHDTAEKSRESVPSEVDNNILEQWGEERYDKVKENVSPYALTTYLEFGAESLTSVTSDPAPSDIARAGHARLMHALGRPADYIATDLAANLAAVREGTPLVDVLGIYSHISVNEAEEVRNAWWRAIDDFGRDRWTMPTSEERFDAVVAELSGGDWRQAMRDAPDVKTVEKLTRDLVKASFGAPFTLDMAAEKGTHLLSAKEVGTALVTLAREYPRARLESVSFDVIPEAGAPLGVTEQTPDGRTSRMVLNIDHLKESGRLKLTDRLMGDWTGGEAVLPPSVGAAGVVVQQFAHVLANTAEKIRPDYAGYLARQRQDVTAGFIQSTLFRNVETVVRNANGRLMYALGRQPGERAGNLRSTVAAVTAGIDDNSRIGLDHAPDLAPEQRKHYRDSWRVAVANEPDAPDVPRIEDNSHATERVADPRIHRGAEGAAARHTIPGRRPDQSPGLGRAREL